MRLNHEIVLSAKTSQTGNFMWFNIVHKHAQARWLGTELLKRMVY